MARRWVAAGADCLHLVDLDGARDGRSANGDAVSSILDAVDVPCELGGGIRDEQSIDHWIEAGLARLVIGTKALKEPDWFRAMARRHPGRLVLGLDARDGMVATDGWTDVSQRSAIDLARNYADEPMAAIVYTDIAKDGMMAGPKLCRDGGDETAGRSTVDCLGRRDDRRGCPWARGIEGRRVHHRTNAV